ncbi:MAG: hypothetical protein JWO70_4339, partial [Betaproteobacteria bacterium]|nr:hypothetical protein [Betaproteobacteria bacterium]
VESETENAVHGDGNETQAEGDAIYEAHYAKMQEAVSSYLLALHHQPAAAQAGFVYVLADQLFHTYGGGGTFATTAHEGAEFHTNPPLTNTERTNISEWTNLDAPGAHNGKALWPRERAALARKWRAALKRVNAGDAAVKRSNVGTAARRATKSPIGQGATQ